MYLAEAFCEVLAELSTLAALVTVKPDRACSCCTRLPALPCLPFRVAFFPR